MTIVGVMDLSAVVFIASNHLFCLLFTSCMINWQLYDRYSLQWKKSELSPSCFLLCFFRFFSILQLPLPALLLVVQKMVNWSDWELTLSSDCTIALRTLRTLKIPLSVAILCRREMGCSGFGNWFMYFYNCFQEFDLGNKGRRHHIILWPLPLEHSATATGLRLPAIPW